jgi:hypothetical protein
LPDDPERRANTPHCWSGESARSRWMPSWTGEGVALFEQTKRLATPSLPQGRAFFLSSLAWSTTPDPARIWWRGGTAIDTRSCCRSCSDCGTLYLPTLSHPTMAGVSQTHRGPTLTLRGWGRWAIACRKLLGAAAPKDFAEPGVSGPRHHPLHPAGRRHGRCRHVLVAASSQPPSGQGRLERVSRAMQSASSIRASSSLSS